MFETTSKSVLLASSEFLKAGNVSFAMLMRCIMVIYLMLKNLSFNCFTHLITASISTFLLMTLVESSPLAIIWLTSCSCDSKELKCVVIVFFRLLSTNIIHLYNTVLIYFNLFLKIFYTTVLHLKNTLVYLCP